MKLKQNKTVLALGKVILVAAVIHLSLLLIAALKLQRYEILHLASIFDVRLFIPSFEYNLINYLLLAAPFITYFIYLLVKQTKD